MTEKELCNMCTEYSQDVKCENKSTCKLLNVVRENKRLIEENKKLKKEVYKLRVKASYMTDPNAIGDRKEMGW